MEEKVKFVWETTIGYEPVEARKEQKFGSMKNRYERIKEAIDTLKTIKELSEKAEKYGVLEVRKGYYEDVLFDNGILKIKGRVLEMLNMNDDGEEWKGKWREILNRLIAYEEEQKRAMEEYFKEAEPFLTVEVVKDDEDEEEYEEGCADRY